MKTQKLFSLDLEAAEWLEELKRQDPKFSASRYISELLVKIASHEHAKRSKLILCGKCGAEYAEHLGHCPGCAVNVIKAEQAEEESIKEAEEQAKKDADVQLQKDKEARERAKNFEYYQTLKGKLGTDPILFEKLEQFASGLSDGAREDPTMYKEFQEQYENMKVRVGVGNIRDYFKLKATFESKKA